MGRINPLLNHTAIGSCYLIHPQFVVTSTHCFDESESRNITFYDETHRKIQIVSSIKGHDISFCKLDEPVNHICPLPILDKEIDERQCAIITGWGNTNDKNDHVHLRWAALRIISEEKNNDIRIERGSLAPKTAKGDSGAPIIVCHDGQLFSAATVRKSGLIQKGMRHFFNTELNAEGPQLSEEDFQSIIDLDYSRRYHRKSFSESPVEEYKDAWRSLDKILIDSSR